MQSRKGWVREPFSGISHLAGAILSLMGMIALLVAAHGKPMHVLSFIIYGLSLVILYTGSALYHSLYCSPKHMDHLQRFDHSAIYLLIAGTYAPVCLVLLKGSFGWSILAIQYVLTITGILCGLFIKNLPHWPRVVLYILMGWLALVALPALHSILPLAGLAWLIGGGLVYSIGVIFYATNRPRLWPGKFGAHDLWHVFVLAGSACHYILVYFFIAPRA